MKIAQIPLRPYTRFHFGELKFDHDLALTDTSMFAHSDTLFSALVHAYVVGKGQTMISPEEEEKELDFIEYFEQGRIKVSSLYYYCQVGNTTIHFLPKPVFLDIYFRDETEENRKNRKKYHRIQFVSAKVWKQGFNSENWFDTSKFRILQKKFLVTIEEYHHLFPASTSNQFVQKEDDFSLAEIIHIPKSPKRAHENASIFYQADVEIGGNDQITIGWFFLYEAEDQVENDLKLATNIMAYTGIGGEIKNTGRTIKQPPTFKPFDFALDNSEHLYYVNLSLLSPKSPQDFEQVLFYKTMLRGGRRLSLEGKKYADVVRMIAEGALLTADTVKGKMATIGTDEFDRPMKRNGIPLLLPVNFVEKLKTV